MDGHILPEEMRREARAAGLGRTQPTLEHVERRRLQVWVIGIGLLIAVSIGVALLSTGSSPGSAPTALPVLRVAIVALPLAFGAYAIEKERRLGRLARLLTEQRVLVADYERRVHEMTLLVQAGRSMNAVLELPVVLETILQSAMELLDGRSGSVMLLETTDELVTVLSDGPDDDIPRRVRIGSGTPGRVAESRTAVLVEKLERLPEGHGVPTVVRSGVSVPLVSRGVLFGVLNIQAHPSRSYTDYDLDVASLFAEHAAAAIANARLYERERSRGDRAELAIEFRSLHDAASPP